MLIPHRCKVAFVGALLSDEQMVELARGTTFYLNTSRAEGSCLPVQNFLAAGRPCVAPAHTGLADSVNADNSLVVASHPEPICFPQDPQLRLQTTWHRLVWQSLHDQLRVAYRIARQEPARYEAMAGHAREHMRDLATPPRVWPLLEAALDDAAGAARAQAGDQPIPAPLRRAA
jgi:glycosyltransferase involved in cell wall biosynthesis